MSAAPTLTGDRVVLRAGTSGDVPALEAVFATPEVARWWAGEDRASLAALIAGDHDDTVWVVQREGRVIGLAQAYEETDPQYRHGGIDLAIHPDHHGVGIGPEVVSLVLRHLVAAGHHRVVIDPAAANVRAIHAYEKAGFRRVGVMRAHQWDPHLARWTDGLLMEWVAEGI